MAHQRSRTPRPWYCNDKAIDEYRTTLERDQQDFPMLKTLKILRAIIVNLGVFGGWFYALSLGGDPTVITVFALAVIGGYNGLELSDYLALVRAYNEIQTDNDDGGGS